MGSLVMPINLHRSVISLANLPPARWWVTRSRLTRSVVRRFIAGDTVDEAVAASIALQDCGIDSALDLLGENVTDANDAARAAESYIAVLDAADKAGLRSPYVSVKLTALGLDLSHETAAGNLRRILEFAAKRPSPSFVRVDMEGSAYTEATIAIVKRAHAEFSNVGIVLQSYLYRTDADVEEMIGLGIPVRLVKGAYAEPSAVAYPRKVDVDAAYRRQLAHLLASGLPTAVATHDPKMIRIAKRIMRERRLDNRQVEFQLLYGVGTDLRDDLAREGYHVRTYIPFGSQWYPYFVRRIAERPANLFFLLKSQLASK